MRRIMVMLVGTTLVAPTMGGFGGFTLAADAPIESLAAAPRVFSRTVPGRTVPGRTVPSSGVRQYRSYSIEPGIAAEATPAPLMEGVGVAPPAVPTYSAPRSSRPSKPSYMRADSKAKGQFGR
jgi:hypothetical protein